MFKTSILCERLDIKAKNDNEKQQLCIFCNIK